MIGFDKSTHTMVYDRITKGKEFFGGYQWIDAADSSEKYIRIKTGASKIHGTLNVEVDGKCLLEFFEDTTINASGTLITNRNFNRNSSNTSNLELYYDTTTTNDGTKLGGKVFGSSSTGGFFGTSASGGLIEGVNWFLKPNSEYVLKVTNQAGETTNILVQYEWHEHNGE